MHHHLDIVVVMENLDVQPVAVRYAAALARRMSARLLFLMLIDPNDDWSGDHLPGEGQPRGAEGLKTAYRTLVERRVRSLVDKRVSLRVEVLVGDRRSEFLKYMAASPAFHTAVWGGTERALRQCSARGRRPWTACIAKELSCPFVIPRAKTRSKPRTT